MYVLVYVVGCKSYTHSSLNVFHMTSRFARARSLLIHPQIANKCATIPALKSKRIAINDGIICLYLHCIY